MAALNPSLISEDGRQVLFKLFASARGPEETMPVAVTLKILVKKQTPSKKGVCVNGYDCCINGNSRPLGM
jgi:hypothetical protein